LNFNIIIYCNVEIEINADDPTNQGVLTEGLTEGDIAGLELGSSDGKVVHHNAINLTESLWIGGIVPYTISGQFSKYQ